MALQICKNCLLRSIGDASAPPCLEPDKCTGGKGGKLTSIVGEDHTGIIQKILAMDAICASIGRKITEHERNEVIKDSSAVAEIMYVQMRMTLSPYEMYYTLLMMMGVLYDDYQDHLKEGGCESCNPKKAEASKQ